MGHDKPGRRPLLFEPLRLRDITIPNRIMISPMCQYCAQDAVPHDWHFVHLGSRAAGGAGIVMSEATAVDPAGRITPFDLGIWNDEQEAAFLRIAGFIGEQGAVAGIQLAHAGRKASHARPWEERKPLSPEEGGWPVVGPSAMPWVPEAPMPRELTPEDIRSLVQGFRMAAKRAHRAGFRLLELHAAHGYLFHSFLSPVTNRRKDGYGGDFEGRSRFLLETVEALRAVWPGDLPLLVRLSVTDWVEGGWELADTVRLAKLLSSLGVDAIDCSSGGIVPGEKIKVHPGYQVPLAEALRREAKIRTIAVGLIQDPTQAEEIIANERADLVAIGRLALWDPYWPYHAAKVLGVDPPLPIQYARADIFSK